MSAPAAVHGPGAGAVSSDAAPGPAPAIIPAATVILVHDQDGLEVLMLRRTSAVAFGGMWVFPGGHVEDADRRPDDDGDEPGTAGRHP